MNFWVKKSSRGDNCVDSVNVIFTVHMKGAISLIQCWCPTNARFIYTTVLTYDVHPLCPDVVSQHWNPLCRNGPQLSRSIHLLLQSSTVFTLFSKRLPWQVVPSCWINMTSEKNQDEVNTQETTWSLNLQHSDLLIDLTLIFSLTVYYRKCTASKLGGI